MTWNPAKRHNRPGNDVVAIHLGSRTTKAIYLRREKDKYSLVRYTVQAAPVEENQSVEILAQHLANVMQALDTKTPRVVVALGAADSSLRCTDLFPEMALPVIRSMLKINAQHYLQQDLGDDYFDCWVVPPSQGLQPGDSLVVPSADNFSQSDQKKSGPKQMVWVGSAKKERIREIEEALESIGLTPSQITISVIQSGNACQFTMPEIEKKVVGLVDIGFKHTTISILRDGVLVLNRVVEVGGHTLTAGLAEALNVTYSVAEGIKEMMPDKVWPKLTKLLEPLIIELRSSFQFFEQQSDQFVQELLVSGGSARSDLILKLLEAELKMPCSNWSPINALNLQLPPEQLRELQRDPSQLAVAVGAAIGFFQPGPRNIDLLGEKKEAAALKRRDPLRRCAWWAGFVTLFAFLWAGNLRLKAWYLDLQIARATTETKPLEPISREVAANKKQIAELQKTLNALDRLATNRFLWAMPLNALQHTTMDGIQLFSIRIDSHSTGIKNITQPLSGSKSAAGKKKIAIDTETVTMTIQAKDSGDPPAAEKFMEAIAKFPYFQNNLARSQPILLKDHPPRQVDPADPSKSFVLFSFDCYFPERTMRDE